MKTIAVCGSTGFIGSHLEQKLKNTYRLIPVTRRDILLSEESFDRKFNEADVFINLAGAPVIKRWTEKNRKEIYSSRIDTTRKIAGFLNRNKEKERYFINASAIGIYASTGKHDEQSKEFAQGFMKELILDWEDSAFSAGGPHRVAVMRLGIVIARNGGIIRRLRPLFKAGMGAFIGNGKQYMSLIHMNDLTESIRFLIEQRKEGIYNMVGPEPVTNKEFSKALGRVLQRPVLFRVPVFMLRILFGEGSGAITSGQYVLPNRLMNSGYEFKYQNIKEMLQDVSA